MTLYKPIKGKIEGIEEVSVITETGHKVIFKPKIKIFVDLDNHTDDKKPFYYVTFDNEYIDTIDDKNPLTLDQIRKKYKNSNLLSPELEYDHVQIGFVYSNKEDPNNNKWMLNFMDVNNKYLFGWNGNSIKLNCPFTTTSWEDGNWHGRFIVYKKDVKELLELKEGDFVLNGGGDIGNHNITPIEDGVDIISLRYNIYENTWYCEYLKEGKIIGSTPCKNIICDAPFEGKIDRSSEKPKVTAEIKIKDVKGISTALNALIIKAK